MGMGGVITAVADITTVGTVVTTMAGGIIAIGGDFHPRSKRGHSSRRPLSLIVIIQGRSQFGRYR